MKSNLLISAISLILVSTAAQAIIQPERCPDVSSIIAVGVTEAERYDAVRWVAGHTSSYNTKEEWTFVVSPFDAKDATDALSKATATLSTLNFDRGPTDYDGRSFCIYKIELGLGWAVAVTPAYSSNIKSIITQVK